MPEHLLATLNLNTDEPFLAGVAVVQGKTLTTLIQSVSHSIHTDTCILVPPKLIRKTLAAPPSQAKIGLLVNLDMQTVFHYVEIPNMPSILRTKLLLNLNHALDRKAASTYLHPGPHYEGSYHAISCYFSLVGPG